MLRKVRKPILRTYCDGFCRSQLSPLTLITAHAEEANKTFNALLKSELFGSTSYSSIPSSLDNTYLGPSPSTSRYAAGNPAVSAAAAIPTTPTRTKNLFTYNSPSKQHGSGSGSRNGSAPGLDSPTHEKYSASPVRYESQRMLLSPRKTPRALSKVPFKVLDAPELAVKIILLIPRQGCD